MARLTIKSVNKAIAARGIKAELVKGDGYFWFSGDDVEYASTTSVMVFNLNSMPIESWMADLDMFVAEHKKVAADL